MRYTAGAGSLAGQVVEVSDAELASNVANGTGEAADESPVAAPEPITEEVPVAAPRGKSKRA